MPASTARGYPYPLPTEPVAEGAQRIRELAEAIQAKSGIDLIAAVTVSSVVATMDFPAIPQLYRALMLVGAANSADANNRQLSLRINGDGSNAYDCNSIRSVFNTAPAVIASSGADVWRIGEVASPEPNTFRVDLAGYRSGSLRKTYVFSCGGYIVGGMMSEHGGGRYYATPAAITRLTLYVNSGSFGVGSYAALYGLV